MTTPRNVLVTGATGQQGGAVARALLSRRHRVKALTRNPDSDAARRLASAGAEIVAGDLADTTSLAKAAGAVDTMFLMGSNVSAGAEEEARQGILAADAAKAAGVGHLIYSSVAGANKKTGIPHFESKYRVESHLAGLGIPVTISAPVAFIGKRRLAVVARRAAPGHARVCNASQAGPSTGGPGRYRCLRRSSGRAARAGVRQAFRFCRRRTVRRGAGEDSVAQPSAGRSPIRKSRSR